jgi:hypothetical protein
MRKAANEERQERKRERERERGRERERERGRERERKREPKAVLGSVPFLFSPFHSILVSANHAELHFRLMLI